MRVSQLPSLSALRVLESVSRHGSFAAAASELGMTQSAISYQVRNLESSWDVKLFDRTRRGVTLTQDGILVRNLAQVTLQNIVQTFGKVRQDSHSDSIRVCAPPSLAALWLVPRLEGFLAAHPGIEIVLKTASPGNTGGDGSFDLMLSIHPEAPCGEDCREVLTDICFPVASTALLREQEAPLDSLEGLRRVCLLDRTLPNSGALTWDSWFEQFGIDVSHRANNKSNGIRFGNSNLQIIAAEAGMGVALSRGLLVLDRLKSGALNKVGNAWLPFPNKLFASLDTKRTPQVEMLFDWIMEEAGRSESELCGLI
ncbi:LysR family transcriptional regulator [Yoonia sp. GPGPB17]|uniref:LysR family transcriptional regulator n=1 Tax=Yoonia sp. GPGPB17 TaxID=3026147 RepID=UPI0030C45EF8